MHLSRVCYMTTFGVVGGATSRSQSCIWRQAELLKHLRVAAVLCMCDAECDPTCGYFDQLPSNDSTLQSNAA